VGDQSKEEEEGFYVSAGSCSAALKDHREEHANQRGQASNPTSMGDSFGKKVQGCESTYRDDRKTIEQTMPPLGVTPVVQQQRPRDQSEDCGGE
jgi:hypothetical protein